MAFCLRALNLMFNFRMTGADRVPVASLVSLAMGPVVVAILLLVAHQTDEVARIRDEQLVNHGVTTWISSIEGRLVGEVYWDEALGRLSHPLDQHWATTNIGQFYFDRAGVERAYVVDAQDRTQFASRRGKTLPAADPWLRDASLSPLIRQIREGETKLYANWRSDAHEIHPLQSSHVVNVHGQVLLATASLVESDAGRLPREGRAPIVLTFLPIPGAASHALADQFLLRDLRLTPGPDLPADRNLSSVGLADAGGKTIARFVWTPEQPGKGLLRRLLAPVLLACGAMMVVVSLMTRRERAAARSMAASEVHARHLAFHDPLTGLGNRALLSEQIALAMGRLRRDGVSCAVLVVGLDRFKLINDTFGHAAGDRLIELASSRILAGVSSNDVVARVSGDEFAILVQADREDTLVRLADHLLDVLRDPYELGSDRVFCTASIGWALVTHDHSDPAEWLRQAEVALHAAKLAGGGGFMPFQLDLDRGQKSRRRLEGDLRGALAAGSLWLAYQPQVDAKGGVFGVEALLRWSHPERGPVSPAEFISVAEDCGLIGAVGEFTLRRAFADSLRWPTLKVAVNVSSLQLRNLEFVELVRSIAAETGADPRRIELEITESVLLADDAQTLSTLHDLRGAGFSIALDDFGTGYSSLSYLRKYPVDKIKIDRAFVTSLGMDRQAEVVVAAIVKLARAMDLSVIAEGVETDLQRIGLRRAGCGDFQGYLFSRPVPADGISEMLCPSGRPATTRSVRPA